jgi:hypothetical protein
MEANQIFLWAVTGIAALVAINALWKLVNERERLTKDELNDDDRAFVWQIVLFIIFPLINFLSLRATIAICYKLGGYIKELRSHLVSNNAGWITASSFDTSRLFGPFRVYATGIAFNSSTIFPTPSICILFDWLLCHVHSWDQSDSESIASSGGCG